MAIRTLLAIALLSFGQALNLPSPAQVFAQFRRQNSDLQAALENTLSSQRVSPQVIRQSQTGIRLLDGDCADAEFLNRTCSGHWLRVMGLISADNATVADNTAAIEGFCDDCGAEMLQDDVDAVIAACNITEEDDVEVYQRYQRSVAVAEAFCANPDCAGNVLIGLEIDENNSTSSDDRRDALCPNVECGFPIVSALLTMTMGANDTQLMCLEHMLDLQCLTDGDTYCSELTDGDDGPMTNLSTLEAFCDTSCPWELTLIMREIMDGGCMEMMNGGDDNGGNNGGDDNELMADGEDDCGEENADMYNMICTKNENDDFCAGFMIGEDGEDGMFPNVSACPFASGDMVPAPGADVDTCSPECKAQLDAATAARGCCLATMLENSCAPEDLTTFIGDTCDQDLDVCDAPEPPTSTESESPSTPDGAATIVAGASAVVIGLVTLVALS